MNSADVIHLVHLGRIVESGIHEELLTKDGPHTDSWSKQMYPLEPALL